VIYILAGTLQRGRHGSSEGPPHKSEPFLEKVKVAEINTDPPKREQEPLIVFPFLPKPRRSFSMLGGNPVKAGTKRQNLFGQPVAEDPSKCSGVKSRKKPAGEKNEVNSKYPLSDAANRDAAKGKGFDNQDAH